MGRYAAERLLLTAPTLVALSLIIFFMVRVVIQVDAVSLRSSGANVSDPQREAQLRKEYGLTGSLPSQYIGWAGRLLRGDFGKSFWADADITAEMAARIPVSVEIGLGSMLITVVLAIPIGILSAVKQDSAADYLSRGTAIFFYAIPGFWVATLVIVLGNRWFGFAPRVDFQPLWTDPVANMKQVALPILLLGLSPIGTMIRLVRTQVLEVVRQDYVRTARAKGLSPRVVYTRHVLRNSLLPIVTVIGLQVPNIVAGTVIFEQIFVLPGVGRYLLDAVQRLDLYVLMAANLFFGALIVVSNLVVDLTYTYLDPRIRLG